MSSRLKDFYKSDIVPVLYKEFNYTNIMQVPRLSKVLLNTTSADVLSDSKVLSHMIEDMSLITGQKPVVVRAKKSIAAFKLREGQSMGCKVTLRKDIMYQFIDRLVTIALPRVRDFSGLSKKSFDSNGNFAFGLKEQTIFIELDYDKIDKARGFDVILVTTAKTDKEAKRLLELFNFPFKN